MYCYVLATHSTVLCPSLITLFFSTSLVLVCYLHRKVGRIDKEGGEKGWTENVGRVSIIKYNPIIITFDDGESNLISIKVRDTGTE